MDNTAASTGYTGTAPAPGSTPSVYDAFDLGDTVSFEVTLDLPQVTSDGKSDLTFELFGMTESGGEYKKHGWVFF